MKFLALVSLILGLFYSVPAFSGTYSDDWKAFVKKIDKDYPFFDLKKNGPDWEKNKKPLTDRVDACKSDGEFLLIIADAVKTLRDAHINFSDTKVPLPKQQPEYCLPVVFMPATDDRVIVMESSPRGPASVLKPGTVILEIDGQPARELLNRQALNMWNKGGYFSSPQKAAFLAYRLPLASPESKDHTVTYLDHDKKATVALKNDLNVRSWLHTYNLPEGLVKTEGSCYYTKLPSQIGYIYLRRIQKEKTTQGMLNAIKACPDVKGWIIDLRGNSGGSYGKDLINAFASLTRPVAVITDAGCISSGETAIRDLKNQANATVFGQTSAGSSTAKETWTFPSGIATLILSTRSRFGPDRKPIEFNGIKPDVAIEPVPEEVAQGKNSEILRAEEFILKLK